MDKRQSTRRRVLKRIHVSFSEKNVGVECILRNLSEHGALIEFTDSLLIPSRFLLHNEWDGYKVDCEIVKRTKNLAGVKFIGQKQPITPTRRQVIDTPARIGLCDLPAEDQTDTSQSKNDAVSGSEKIVKENDHAFFPVFGKR